MASQGPNAAGAGADDASIGTTAWVNPGNITASDDSRATASLATTTVFTHYLVASVFGFSIPVGSTIDGIVVEIERSSFAAVASAKDNAIRIVKGGSIGSTDKSSASTWPNNNADAIATYGTSSDLWGKTWTASDINDSTFGMAISAKGNNTKVPGKPQVDFIRITVYYTAPAGGGFRDAVDCGPINCGLVDGGLAS